MASGKKGVFDFYLVMKDHTIKTFDTDSTTRQPIGGVFFELMQGYDHGVIPVKCTNCGSLELAYFYEPNSAGSEERSMGTESIFYLSADQYCLNCDDELRIEILISNYAHELLCEIDEKSGCEPVNIGGLTKLLEDGSNALDAYIHKDD